MQQHSHLSEGLAKHGPPSFGVGVSKVDMLSRLHVQAERHARNQNKNLDNVLAA